MKKVAVITSRSPDGVQGGAERHYEGIINAFAGAGWNVTEIPIFFDETSVAAILDGYSTAQNLNVLSYDLVVSTKVPSYAVLHPNHACWLVHTVRVFYDKYDDAISHEPWAPEARRQIMELDNKALGRSGVRRFANGHTVARRLERYNNLKAVALYPPHPNNDLFLSATVPWAERRRRRYFFTASRLHAWKRVDMIIKGFKRYENPTMRLVIAGDGPEKRNLVALAGDDPRIEFAGQVDDATLAELYRGAMAVLFTPSDEDYGYITAEAFLCGTPVITVTDSGEPAAIVAGCGGGIVCEPTSDDLAAAMSRLERTDGPGPAMGDAGRSWAIKLSWPHVVEALSNG